MKTFSGAGILAFGLFLISTCVVHAQWTTSGSDIYYNAGNVGVGGIPARQFEVVNSSNAAVSLVSTSSDKVLLSNPGNLFQMLFQDDDMSASDVFFREEHSEGGQSVGTLFIGSGITGSGGSYPNLAVGNGAFSGGGQGNTAIGHQAFGRMSSGDYNVSIGRVTGYDLESGNNNTLVGQGAGLTSSFGGNSESWSGTDNLFLGAGAGDNIANSAELNGNVLIGTRAGDGQSLSGADGNILIGTDTNLPNGGGDFQLNIGNLLYGLDISGTHNDVSPGKIGIGSTSPGARLSVQANPEDGASLFAIGADIDDAPISLYQVTSTGHHVYGGLTPSVSSCGTSPTITGNDSRGRVEVGSGTVTSCTVTFVNSWSNAPVCQIALETGSPIGIVVTPSTSDLELSSAASLDGQTFGYSCDGF